jgi:L-lactate dehydrogenase (cytochrome)
MGILLFRSRDLVSKRLNSETYRSVLLRPRIIEQCDVSTSLVGLKVGLPVYVSPAAMARLGHPTGEAGIA